MVRVTALMDDHASEHKALTAEHGLSYLVEMPELRLLFDLSQVIDHSRDISHSLEATLSLMAQHLHMMRGMITLVSPHTGEIRIEVAHGLNPAEQRRGHYALGEGVTGRVIQSGQPMVVSNVSASPIFLNRTCKRIPSPSSVCPSSSRTKSWAPFPWTGSLRMP